MIDLEYGRKDKEKEVHISRSAHIWESQTETEDHKNMERRKVEQKKLTPKSAFDVCNS